MQADKIAFNSMQQRIRRTLRHTFPWGGLAAWPQPHALGIAPFAIDKLPADTNVDAHQPSDIRDVVAFDRLSTFGNVQLDPAALDLVEGFNAAARFDVPRNHLCEL